MSVPKMKFGDWLPDQPDLDNPGVLEALNVRPVGSQKTGYAPYLPLATSNNAFTTTAPLVVVPTLAAAGSTIYMYVGTFDGHIYQSLAAAGSWTDYSGGALIQVSDLCQYNTLMFAADLQSGVYQQTVGAAVNFAFVTGAPKTAVLGVIGQFLVAGGSYPLPSVFPNLLLWSGIGNPTSWPTPGSATAIAQQSGQQFLHLEFGSITGIYGGDQWGIVLQQNAITRVTYVGGSTVFQFDTLSAGIGMDFAHAGVKIGGKVYFACSRGFYATDGTTVDPIGEEKINRWFIANVVVNAGVLSFGRVAVDWANKIIIWSFAVSGATIMVLFNFETQRFAHTVDVNVSAMAPAPFTANPNFGTPILYAIGQDKKIGTFVGTPGTATIITAEAELNPGERAIVQGFRPQISGSTSFTCQIGSRFRQGDSVSFTSSVTPNSITGYADCLIESAYHRARTDISGNFTQALGGEFLYEDAGAF